MVHDTIIKIWIFKDNLGMNEMKIILLIFLFLRSTRIFNLYEHSKLNFEILFIS